ncbi:hypothetical protein [Methylocapsa palsarum]|uniref:hypothetical protein n=1 Tax=Methylocapsa palsarum TaxID=1612308 RepID=UPI0015871FA0|nr:hypothetical protein [Methylocapsa palsarum]
MGKLPSFGAFDLTGPVQIQRLADKSVSYRLSCSVTHGGQFVDFITNQNVFLAPASSWNIDPSTRFTIEAEYTHQNSQDYVGQQKLRPVPQLQSLYARPRYSVSGEHPGNPLVRRPEPAAGRRAIR